MAWGSRWGATGATLYWQIGAEGCSVHAMLDRQDISISDVRVPAKRAKTLEPSKVQEIAEDMLENGQTTPIRVRAATKGFVLIEGLHRLEALRALGEKTVEAYLVQARLH
jgi:sulfiredoxin